MITRWFTDKKKLLSKITELKKELRHRKKTWRMEKGSFVDEIHELKQEIVWLNMENSTLEEELRAAQSELRVINKHVNSKRSFRVKKQNKETY